MMEERKAAYLSRREIGKVLALFLGNVLIGNTFFPPRTVRAKEFSRAKSGVDTQAKPETGLDVSTSNESDLERHIVHSWRYDLQMFFSTAAEQANHIVDQLNYLWREFFLKHEEKSPDVMEGIYTKFGPSSIARGQLLVNSDELIRLIQLHKVDPNLLPPAQQNVLRVREAFDRHGIDEIYSLDSVEYVDAFMTILHELGYEGIVAMKSPNDSGREVFVSVWNKLREEWSEPMKAVCLNTATYKTWRDWVTRFSPFNDYSGVYNANLGWVIELSNELIEKGGTQFDADNMVGGFVRVIDVETLVEVAVSFPKVERVRPDFHPSMRGVAIDVHRVAQLLDDQALDDTLLSLPETFEHTFGESTKETEVDQQSLIPYVLHEFGLKNDVNLPFFFGQDFDQLKAAMELSVEEDEAKNGLPLGQYLIHEFLRKISNAGYLQRHVVVDADTELPNQAGMFFVEKFSQGAVELGPQGFYYQVDDMPYFAYVDEQRTLHREPFATLHEQQVSGQPMSRVIVLTAN